MEYFFPHYGKLDFTRFWQKNEKFTFSSLFFQSCHDFSPEGASIIPPPTALFWVLALFFDNSEGGGGGIIGEEPFCRGWFFWCTDCIVAAETGLEKAKFLS